MTNIRIFDSGESYADRYTVVINEHDGSTSVYGMGDTPYHPQGFCQYVGDYVHDEWLLTQEEIDIDDVNSDVQTAILDRMPELV